jgi:hypothetical protein
MQRQLRASKQLSNTDNSCSFSHRVKTNRIVHYIGTFKVIKAFWLDLTFGLLFTKNSEGFMAGTKPSTTMYRNTSLRLVLRELQNSSPTPTIVALSPIELKPASGIFDVLIQIQTDSYKSLMYTCTCIFN